MSGEHETGAAQGWDDEVTSAGLESAFSDAGIALATLSLTGVGGRKPRKEIDFEIIRPLGNGDLAELSSPSPLPPPQAVLRQMRHTHHQLAQFLAQGMNETEAGLISGYTPAYISVLKGDPAFQELLTSYGETRKIIFVDVLERMKSLGISTLEEIQSRLAEDATQFSNRELQELARMLLVEKGGGGQGGGGPSVQVAISFVTAALPEPPTGPLLEMTRDENGMV